MVGVWRIPKIVQMSTMDGCDNIRSMIVQEVGQNHSSVFEKKWGIYPDELSRDEHHLTINNLILGLLFA